MKMHDQSLDVLFGLTSGDMFMIKNRKMHDQSLDITWFDMVVIKNIAGILCILQVFLLFVLVQFEEEIYYYI